MTIEQEIFEKRKIDFEKLVKYGFKKNENGYFYEKNILNDSFSIRLNVDFEGEIFGKIYDLGFNEEYVNFRVEEMSGSFVNNLRDEFKGLLRDVAAKCTNRKYFTNKQANRIAELISGRYGDEPVYLWEKHPDYAVFRNPNNDKWYGAIMNVPRSKIGLLGDDNIDIIDVKLDEEEVEFLIDRDGFFPAYHMNKKKWITIVLDETLDDDKIMEYIEESHKFTDNRKSWIVPANPKYFDVISYMDNNRICSWGQKANMSVGDFVYVYVGAPYSEIMYQCKVLRVNILDGISDGKEKEIEVEVLKKYGSKEFTFNRIQALGLKSVRSARGIPEELRVELEKE